MLKKTVIMLVCIVSGLLTFASVGEAETVADNSSKLLDLARKKFSTLTPAEEKLFQTVAEGAIADYRTKNTEDNEPSKAKGWGVERSLKSDRITWLCSDEEALGFVAHRGIVLIGVRIDGELDLQFVTIRVPLVFSECAILSGVKLQHAKIRMLSLQRTHTGRIVADSLRVEGDMLLREGSYLGGVRIVGGNIGGQLACQGGKFIAAKDPMEKALNGNSLKVDGSVFLNDGFHAKGEVDFNDATIGGSLDCSRGEFIGVDGMALNGDGLAVEGNLFLRNGFRAEGTVDLRGATIVGQMSCKNAQIINPDGYAINADSLEIGRSILFSDGFRAEGEVRLVSATIGGQMGCTNAQFINPEGNAIIADGFTVVNDVILGEGFRAEGKVRLHGTSTTIGGTLSCDGGQFINTNGEALDGDSLTVGGSVFLRNGFRAEGEVYFVGATIGGQLSCNNGKFFNEGKTALTLNGATVNRGVFLGDGFHATGMVDIGGANIGALIDCGGGRFIDDARALNLNSVSVDGSIFLNDGFDAKGTVNLISAQISGQLNCSGRFSCANGVTNIYAVNAFGMEVKEDVSFANGFDAMGMVGLNRAIIDGKLVWKGIGNPDTLALDLRFAKVGILSDERKSWPRPGNLLLGGLTYGMIKDDSLDVQERLDWLGLQPKEHFSFQPYEQLAEVLRQDGHEDEAKEVLIAKNKDRVKWGTRLTLGGFLWYRIFGPVIGYGYRPLRAFWWAAGCIIIGWLLFWKEHRKFPNDSLVKDLPKFCSLVYSIDTFVPLIDLHQAKYWLPKSRYSRCWHWLQISAGWVLTTLLVGGLTGLMRT